MKYIMAYVCNACPRKCGAVRPNGFCGVGEKIKISKVMTHMWEEPCISGTKGSGAVFFSGCNLSCVFCQNYEISTKREGFEISLDELKTIYIDLIKTGVHNINLVTPSHFILEIAKSLTPKPEIPIVYNCGGYEDNLDVLNGLCDIYLVDLKYGNNNTAFKYSRAKDYVEVCIAALEKMYSQVGDYIIKDGIMQKGMIVRHLLLPQNIDNSLDAIDLFYKFSKNKKIKFSLMSQYTPCGRAADFPEINRTVTAHEYSRATRYLERLGIYDGYIQDLNSADTAFIPNWENHL